MGLPSPCIPPSAFVDQGAWHIRNVRGREAVEGKKKDKVTVVAKEKEVLSLQV